MGVHVVGRSLLAGWQGDVPLLDGIEDAVLEWSEDMVVPSTYPGGVSTTGQ
jgi:hypothetical protein